MVQFHVVTLFSFDFLSNFLKYPLAGIMLHIVFPCLGVSRGDERVPAFLKIFRYDSGSSIKLLSRGLYKMILLSMVRLYPGQGMPSPVPSKKGLVNAAVLASPHKQFESSNAKL